MPTYGYECLGCSSEIEVFQSIKDAPLTTCESCGGTLRKRIYPVGIAFKGSGFYVNDYARKGGESDGGASPESKTEAKPEAKTDGVKTEAAKTEAPKTDAPKTDTAKAAA